MERGDLSGAILDGRYRVIEPIAEGAMGVVYRAERVKLGRIVAVKVLHDVLPDELSGRRRFEIEAMAMAKLEHPHCASVLDVGVHNDRPFVVMDFVSGQNLKELISGGPLPIPRAAEIVRQVLSGLGHAHEHGIIHRDIKPANLVLSQKTGLGDHVKILDFGLARVLDTSQNLTAGLAVGTPAYMAPEQVRGDKLDHRADLYACGVLLFELLTGKKPFQSERDDPIEVCKMHLSDPIPRLDSKLPGVDFGELEAVVTKALAKRARKRFASAEEYAAALDAAVGRTVRQTQPSRVIQPPRPSRPTRPLPVTPAAEISSADASYPPPVEVGSGDVMSTEPLAPTYLSADMGIAEAAAGVDLGHADTAAATGAAHDIDAALAAVAAARAFAGQAAVAEARVRAATPPVGTPAAGAASEPRTPPATPAAVGALRSRVATPPSGLVAAAGSLWAAAPAALDVNGAGAGPRLGAATPAAGAGKATDSEPIGTFLGMVVSRTPIPATRAPVAAPVSAPAAARPRRWPWVAAIVVGVLVAGGIAVAVIARRGGGRASPPAASAAHLADPAGDVIARANELAAQGDKDAALDLLAKSRKQFPDSAGLPYAAGRIYFSRYYWSEGLKSFRDAIKLDAGYRSDPELIKTVLRGFVMTPSYNEDLASFLHDDIGSAAQPMLEETARDHPSPAIRTRAANELRRYH